MTIQESLTCDGGMDGFGWKTRKAFILGFQHTMSKRWVNGDAAATHCDKLRHCSNTQFYFWGIFSQLKWLVFNTHICYASMTFNILTDCIHMFRYDFVSVCYFVFTTHWQDDGETADESQSGGRRIEHKMEGKTQYSVWYMKTAKTDVSSQAFSAITGSLINEVSSSRFFIAKHRFKAKIFPWNISSLFYNDQYKQYWSKLLK